MFVLFVYSLVDNNTDYDALEQLSRDAEDKYFNDDDSETSDTRSQPVAEYDFWDIVHTLRLSQASLICFLNINAYVLYIIKIYKLKLHLIKRFGICT